MASGFSFQSSSISIDPKNGKSFLSITPLGMAESNFQSTVGRSQLINQGVGGAYNATDYNYRALLENLDYELRICILGDKGVGKSTLLQRELGTYNDALLNNDEDDGVGIRFKTKFYSMYDTAVKVDFWDTPGDEAWRSQTVKLASQATAYIFVFDVTNRQSYKNISRWLKECQVMNEHDQIVKPTIIIGNKSDFEMDTDLDDLTNNNITGTANIPTIPAVQNSSNNNNSHLNSSNPKVSRTVTMEEAVNWTEPLGADYFETSALQNEGVVESFEAIVKHIIRSIPDNPEADFFVENMIKPKKFTGLKLMQYRKYLSNYRNVVLKDGTYTCDWM